MAHFAQIDSNNIVTQVLVIDQETVDTGLFGEPSSFIQTSYNTRGGVHYGQDGQPDDGVALNKNYAGIGFNWDGTGFYAPQCHPEATLDKTTYNWICNNADHQPKEITVGNSN